MGRPRVFLTAVEIEQRRVARNKRVQLARQHNPEKYRERDQKRAATPNRKLYQATRLKAKGPVYAASRKSKFQVPEYSLNYKYHWLKSTAKRRDLAVEFSKEEFIRLIKDAPCYYCKAPITMKFGSGLDRLDSALNYTLSNAVPCCPSCNRIKGEHHSPEETHIMVNALLEFRKLKEKSQ